MKFKECKAIRNKARDLLDWLILNGYSSDEVEYAQKLYVQTIELQYAPKAERKAIYKEIICNLENDLNFVAKVALTLFK